MKRNGLKLNKFSFIFTSLNPFAFAHFSNKNFDRNQCQTDENATQQKATKTIITFVLVLMGMGPNDLKLSHRANNGK